jgi:hypothetical protein
VFTGEVQNRQVKQSRNSSAGERMAAAGHEREEPISASQFESLPAPVRRYLTAVIPENRRRGLRVRFTQAGVFRVREEVEKWLPFTAEQHVVTNPPGFVWDATIRVAPLLSVRVMDAYQNGRGVLSARLLGVVPVAKASGPEMDEGEMMRYLAEAIWYPTALLPDERLSWRPLDQRSAIAVLSDNGREVSVKFSFDDDGMIYRIDADRYRAENGGYRRRPWSAYCGEYALRNGFRIPLEARVVWHFPQLDLEYFRGRIESIEYDA